MINRVLVAGRVVEPPEARTTPNGVPFVILTLELRHPRFGDFGPDAVPDVCTVKVHALGERRSEILQRYISKGRDLMVEAQLRSQDGELCLSMDRFHFLERGLQSRYLWHQALGEERARAA